jgi:hypothetical protein
MGEVFTGFGDGDMREREHLEDLGVDGMIILKWIFKEGLRGGWHEWIAVTWDGYM